MKNISSRLIFSFTAEPCKKYKFRKSFSLGYTRNGLKYNYLCYTKVCLHEQLCYGLGHEVTKLAREIKRK